MLSLKVVKISLASLCEIYNSCNLSLILLKLIYYVILIILELCLCLMAIVDLLYLECFHWYVLGCPNNINFCIIETFICWHNYITKQLNDTINDYYIWDGFLCINSLLIPVVIRLLCKHINYVNNFLNGHLSCSVHKRINITNECIYSIWYYSVF